MDTQGFGLMLGREGHLPWSHSKAETARTCMYKFARVYLDGERESSPSLLLGSFAHETIEALLRDKEAPTLEKAQAYLKNIYDAYDGVGDKDLAYQEVLNLLDYEVEFVTKWKDFIAKEGISHWKIESAFGLTEDLDRAEYEPKHRRTYMRGKIDLWGYDAKTKTLYIIDHKTNKTADSPKKVKEDLQLNLYVTFITNYYKLDWEKCYFGKNFLRKKKMVWASTTQRENKYFTQVYLNTLHFLENKILDCEMEASFPPEENYKCGMCNFKSTCPLQLAKIEEQKQL